MYLTLTNTYAYDKLFIMNKHVMSLLLKRTNSKKILSMSEIQELWSGYGSLLRLELENKSIIVKSIKYPNEKDHPKGWNSDLSHQRKVKSYDVELNWYKSHNTLIKNAQTAGLVDYFEFENTRYLVLEDLKASGFKVKKSINPYQIKLCIKWLATFHAKYLNYEHSNLWSIGTYWNLETRPDEFKAIKDNKIKSIASVIDNKLNSSPFQTIVHGDAKLANFLLKDDAVSAVDFQYTGTSIGIKDLVYFLTSIYDGEELIKHNKESLEFYFLELNKALKLFHPDVNTTKIETNWRQLYKYAFFDFYRFLKGWSPNHYKLNSYSEKIINEVLNEFN